MSLLIRADACVHAGTGHVMRCLALAQAWKPLYGDVTFVCARIPAPLKERLEAEGFNCVCLPANLSEEQDARETVAIAEELEALWVVADGYHFSACYQKVIKAAGKKLLLLDDYGHATHYHADLVLNQNPQASESLYCSRDPHTRLLLGVSYILLRREFRFHPHCDKEPDKVKTHLLVTLGGADEDNVTLNVIQALEQQNCKGVDVTVVVGGGNPHLPLLNQHCLRSHVPITLRTHVADMAEQFCLADLAICAGGSTMWELAFMQVPALSIVLADNQWPASLEMDRLGISRCLGWHQELTVESIGRAVADFLRQHSLRRRMAQRGRNLVDGNGVMRVIAKMAEGCS